MFQKNVFNLFRNAKIPIDPYWAAALLASLRAVISILASNINGKFKRRTVYITCCGIVASGSLLMAIYFYENQNGNLSETNSWLGWIPILAIIICYIGFACGFGSMPYILQVTNYLFETKTYFLKYLLS